MKKKITLILLLVGITGLAQVKGNGTIKTIIVPAKNISEIEMELYAKVIVNASATEEIIITADENLLPLISSEVKDEKLLIEQKEWIRPSQKILITVGAPNIRKVSVGVHETVFVNNLNSDEILLLAPIGKIIANGRTKLLTINSKKGTIDASDLEARNANVSITGSGKVIVNVSDTLARDLDSKARLEYANEPMKIIGEPTAIEMNRNKTDFANARFIDISIKNNSWNRRNFVVEGPKKNGSTFSYGFPMMPGSVKKERWTVGTKVYRKKSMGKRELLLTIKAADEGKTLKLFD
ncbi:MAG: hypothetical protein HKP11_08770 [Flavobacteriaceae bacterium]|nr:hypothetical protein [Flavobacteriaceae bacterium]